ncbi:MAG: hypothetical protein PHU29_06365 [Sulfuricurvum sp.]|nr:hypothetical protein [Sulfuricurvum sp.]MDD2950396.1 hypothetical protein [Sulfuricurvum sp.]MDD5118528.1 hypothetical protein [Sulfuricurvum sp.]
MRGFYTIEMLGDDKSWDDEHDTDQEGCCEDPYDDEEDEEREWCD